MKESPTTVTKNRVGAANEQVRAENPVRMRAPLR